MQSNLTIRVEEQNSNSTSGVDNDKGFWEWLFGSVTSYPPTNTEIQEPEKCLKCSMFKFKFIISLIFMFLDILIL